MVMVCRRSPPVTARPSGASRLRSRPRSSECRRGRRTRCARRGRRRRPRCPGSPRAADRDVHDVGELRGERGLDRLGGVRVRRPARRLEVDVEVVGSRVRVRGAGRRPDQRDQARGRGRRVPAPGNATTSSGRSLSLMNRRSPRCGPPRRRTSRRTPGAGGTDRSARRRAARSSSRADAAHRRDLGQRGVRAVADDRGGRGSAMPCPVSCALVAWLAICSAISAVVSSNATPSKVPASVVAPRIAPTSRRAARAAPSAWRRRTRRAHRRHRRERPRGDEPRRRGVEDRVELAAVAALTPHTTACACQPAKVTPSTVSPAGAGCAARRSELGERRVADVAARRRAARCVAKRPIVGRRARRRRRRCGAR